MKVLFIYQHAFSKKGGIQTFNRCFLKALSDIKQVKDYNLKAVSLYDLEVDKNYINQNNFKSCRGSKLYFVFNSLFAGLKSQIVIISHINLYFIGVLLSIVPGKKIILVTHGIEIWDKLPFFKKVFMQKITSEILAVSRFTKIKISDNNNVDSKKIKVFPNTFDPLISTKNNENTIDDLKEYFGIKDSQKIILTVSRMDNHDREKGYDKVLRCLPEVLKKHPDLKYIMIGKASPEEQKRLENIIDELNINRYVEILQNISEIELNNYYKICDLFVLPSKKEGFGIVFLEALSNGKPVIAGNKDGSLDPLVDGELGILVNPDSIKDITNAIIDVLDKKADERYFNPDYLKKRVLENFGYEKFKNNLLELLT